MDIQDERANIEMMNAMIGTFNDSTDNGKLYLNYPMLESYKHLMSLDDENFKDRCVAVSDCCRYKETVGRECHRSLRNVGDYNLEIFDAIIRMHLRKANYILGDDFVLPPMDKLESLSGGDIMDAQVEKMLKDGSIFVLNTSMFNVVEYRPSDFLNTS
ncbi:MAG: hypothetical protein LBU30_05460 [Candidatus Methanoplasma sp.]|nr:hypothetical protein [Candidatus Methanoplasma sp.]